MPPSVQMKIVRTNNYKNSWRKIERDIYWRIVRELRTNIAMYVADQFKRMLLGKVQANEKPMPEKAESTKQQYRRKGWDTEHFLIRKGESARMMKKRIPGGIKIHLFKPKIIGYHVPSRVDWFRLNFGIRMEVLKRVRKIINGKLGQFVGKA